MIRSIREIADSLIISEGDISNALAAGGLKAVDELFYPGYAVHHARRRKSLGFLKRPFPKTDFETVFHSEDANVIGVRGRHKIYVVPYGYDDRRIYVGYIEKVRRGFLDNYYRTNDGESFAHWGGPEGAETWLVNRYWIYGDPPHAHREPSFISRVFGMRKKDCDHCSFMHLYDNEIQTMMIDSEWGQISMLEFYRKIDTKIREREKEWSNEH